MTGRWSCVGLVLVLAACRTPPKAVSVYPLADDEPGQVSHLQTGSDVGETVTGRMHLPKFADTETDTNSAVGTAPATNTTATGEVESTLAGPIRSTEGLPTSLATGTERVAIGSKLPVPTAAQTEPIHLKPGELPPPVAPTNATAHLDLRPCFKNSGTGISPVRFPGITERTGEPPVPLSDLNQISGHTLPGSRNPPGIVPVAQSIHLNLSAWTNSAARVTTELTNLNVGHPPAVAQRPPSASVTVTVNAADNSSAAPGMARAVAVPVVGPAAPSAAEAVSKPVDLEPLLDGAHDDDWRQRQADRQRAAESARQSERDSLEKTFQQFLQPRAK